MRLFEDFFARPHRKRGQPHFPPNLEGKGCWWDDPSALPLAAARGFNVEVVGELQWQAEIAAAVGGRCEEGHNCQVPAVLVLADDPRDPNAVGVTINSRPVGWIAAAAAAEIRPQLVALNAESRPVTCRAKIVGGWNRGRSDRGYFGVKLSIALPLRSIARPAAWQVRPDFHRRRPEQERTRHTRPFGTGRIHGQIDPGRTPFGVTHRVAARGRAGRE